MHIYPINGACNRVAADATAFAYRDAKFATVIAGMWPDPADNEKNMRWVKDYYRAVHPHGSAGGYVNFMAGDDQGRIRDNYRGNYDRLVAVKRTYDPGQPVPHEPEHQALNPAPPSRWRATAGLLVSLDRRADRLTRSGHAGFALECVSNVRQRQATDLSRFQIAFSAAWDTAR